MKNLMNDWTPCWELGSVFGIRSWKQRLGNWVLGIGNWYSLFCVDYSMLGLIHQCYHNHTKCLLAPVSIDFIFSDE